MYSRRTTGRSSRICSVLLSRADASFIRDDEEPGEVSWEERLARAYESKLFKEFALVRDLSLLRHLAS